MERDSASSVRGRLGIRHACQLRFTVQPQCRPAPARRPRSSRYAHDNAWRRRSSSSSKIRSGKNKNNQAKPWSRSCPFRSQWTNTLGSSPNPAPSPPPLPAQPCIPRHSPAYRVATIMGAGLSRRKVRPDKTKAKGIIEIGVRDAAAGRRDGTGRTELPNRIAGNELAPSSTSSTGRGPRGPVTPPLPRCASQVVPRTEQRARPGTPPNRLQALQPKDERSSQPAPRAGPEHFSSFIPSSAADTPWASAPKASILSAAFSGSLQQLQPSTHRAARNVALQDKQCR